MKPKKTTSKTGVNSSEFPDNWNTSGMRHRKVKKGTILQEYGSLRTKAFYIKSGLLRSYTIDDNGKIHIFRFAEEGSIIGDMECFKSSHPAKLFIDALEDSEVFEFNKSLIEVMEINAESFESKFNELLSQLQKRIIMLMAATAKERYEHFLENYPQLVNRIPQKMIASYLGITPEALSNIKAKSFRKKS